MCSPAPILQKNGPTAGNDEKFCRAQGGQGDIFAAPRDVNPDYINFSSYGLGIARQGINEVLEKEVWPPTVFFAVGFNLIVLTTDLILADYLQSFASFLVATMTALVVGKSVLVANATPLLRRSDTAPLIRTVLFKTFVYWAVVFLVRFVEKLVEYLFAGGTLGEIPKYVATHFTWHCFIAIQIWIFVLFLIYCSLVELNAVLGRGELTKIFFSKRSSPSVGRSAGHP